MRYQMSENAFGGRDKFKIRDESGKVVYEVQGRRFGLGDALSFTDMEGNELAQVKQVVLALSKKYEIVRHGDETVTISKKLFSRKPAFDVDDEGDDDQFSIEGNPKKREYTILRRGTPVANVSRKMFTLGDTYGIDIAAGEDDVMILGLAVAVDKMIEEDELN